MPLVDVLDLRAFCFLQLVYMGLVEVVQILHNPKIIDAVTFRLTNLSVLTFDSNWPCSEAGRGRF